MATNNDDIKWLYGKLKAKGYDIGNEQEFTTSLTNEADRQWYYEKAKGMGLNIGSIEDFNSLYAPQTAQPATPPTQAPAVQSTATAAPTSTPTPTEEPEQAPVQSAPQQPAWQPTEQDKIRMSYQMHTMLNDFNQRSKERIAQIQRMAEPFTAEGRKKRKAMEFQAQLAGTPTKVMGLTPPTSAPASDGAQGDVEGAAQPQPIQSGQSPVPYGVKYIDGKPVTQWLLPDGRLTTSFMEADQAEYGARTARLRHQFENRMKQNGLDPAKPEDVEMQAQYDAQAPAYDAVAELWQEAEEKHKADKERNAKKHWDSYAAMGGGREMRIVTTSMNRHDDNISHMTRFDLQKMMDNAWNRVGSKVTTNCYNRLRQQYPGASEEELQATASQMARQLTDNAVYQYAVQQNTPKSTLEYFGRTVADMNVINSISKGLARSQAGTSGDLAAYEAAMGEYGKNHRVAQIAGTVTGMAVDPVTWVSGGVGSLAGKGAINLGGRFIAGRAATSMSTQVGSRLFSSSLTGRIITGAAAGGGNFATYEMLKEGESQFLHGGHINPETGENEGYSAGAVLSAGCHGLVLGSVTGTLSPVIGNVADKTVKATTSTAGKAGVRFGEVAVSTLAEGTVFSIPEWINGDADAMDVWTDNMAMMLGFKVQHGLKSAPRYIASLRPIKPVDGRPLTQAERNHNRMNFEERLRRNLDASPGDLSFTADEREELRRAGYGELADLFSRDRVQEVQRPDIDPADGAIELRAERVEAETISRNPEFDGYSSMEELMQDGRVSQSARAKAYYILTGRRLPMASVTGYTTTTDADGRVTVNSMAADGEVVTSRTFKNEQEAKQETDNIMRQAELNSVDIGERFKEAVADDMVLDAAISEVSPGADPATIKRIYRAVKAGNKDVTESQRQLVEFLDDAIERNRDIADRYRPEAIREVLKEETGIDVDAVLRKMPSKRTEAEQAVVKSYLERLFPEEARQQAAEPTPEQAEAQSQYEQGRELYGRFEEGDPTVQADVDAIALRMQEAYQAVEDAFGSETEYYMFHVNENPWALVDDPELTVEQKDAVLYYINAKAALDGVMDASNEVADRKRAEVEESVAKRTHKDNGVIIPATMKVDDRQVYIVKGDVVMFPDGTAVDVHNSSESVVVMDVQTGEYQFTSPDQIFQVSEAVNPQDELDTALSVIEQEQMNIFGDNAVAPEESTEGEEPQQTNEAPATADTAEYDRGYEQGLEKAAKDDDAWIANHINILSQNTPESMPDTMKGELDAYLYEQQRRAQSAPESPESVPNPTENPVSDAETAPETFPNVENGQQTALSRIPLNEQGEPMFEAVDKDTAWSGLVEAVGGEADAVDIAMAQVQQATSDLEALKKKPPTQKAPKLKGSPMAMAQAKREAAELYQRELVQYNQQIADTQTRLDAWNGIIGVYTSRNAELRRQQEEERRQRDAIAHDEAMARFKEEQRIKAEKQAEQERIGVHAVNPKIKDKWDAAPKVDGNEDALTLPDGSTISGRYVLTEAGAASPSHDANNAYQPTEGFPIDENDQSVNDRDYMRDKDAQQKVEGMAGNYDNRALQDPVIVSKDGVVLSGNNRTMSGDLAARRGTDKAYVDYLTQFGHKKYGFTPEQVAGMKNPRVVFVPDEALPYDATTFARFNAQEKKSQGKPEAAVKLGKIVPDNVFNVIVNDISRYDRLSDYYADEKAVAQALGSLMQAGVINDMQMPELRTGTALSATGKELIENTLIGKVFQSSPDAVRQIISVPTLRQSIVMGLSEIANNRTLSRNGYDISDELAKAVDLVTRAKNAMPDVYTDGMPVSPFGRMQGLFDDEFGDSRVTDGTTLLLADILNSGKPSDLRKVLTSYNNEASQASGGQIDIFSGSIPTKEEILTTVNEHFRNATPKEQQALVDSAIAERKRRAEESAAEQRDRSETSEQTPHDDERGAESQQPTAGIDEELTPEEQALAARVEITENDWEEGDGDNPTYKRDIIIDGTHKVTQVDAPDEDGHYTGSYFEFDGKRFGDIAEIAQYIDGGMQAEPTEAQKAAGNYKMEHRRVDGYNISIENAKGSVRRGTGADGKPWETTMQNDYGYIRGTEGVDGDHIDVFLSDTPEEGDVFVVDQVNDDDSFDEHKVMYGFPTEQAARDAYLSNYEPGWTGLGAITHVSKDEFKKWIQSSRRKTKPFAEYKSVKAITEDVDQTRTNVNAEGMVVDGEGNPLTLYHGTPNDVEALSDLGTGHPRKGTDEPARFNGDGVSFTPHRDVAEDYASLGDGNKGKVFEANIILKNPYYTVGVANFTPEEAAEFTASLKAKGHDGIINYASQSMRQIGAEPNEVIVFDIMSAVPVKTKQADTDVVYSITPTTYTNKKGKTSDVHLVKFNRELTAEEKAALDTFAREPLTEGKKTSRGWYDRKQGGYMMRSEEAARQLAEMIGNEEAVADAQPMTAEELREAVAPAEKKPARKPKKAPINRVSLEDVMTDLSTKGESKLSDHAEPVKAEPEPQHEISDDEMRSLLGEIRDILGIGDDEGDTDIKFRDPGELTVQERMKLQSAGIRVAMGLISRGTTAFPDYATKMVGLLGDKIRPWLKSFYEGARWTPGYDKYTFTPTEQVATFDVQNFDKKQADPIAQAAMIVEERKASTASAQAQKELIETRNKNRRENDKQTEADTAALAEKAEAVAGEAEVTVQSAGTGEAGRKRILRDLKRVDDTLDEVNDQLAFLGYYEAEEVDKDFNEAYGYMRNAEKKAVKDAVDLAKQLVNDLGLGFDKVTGSTTANRGKRKNAVTANIAPAGGDISIRLPLNEGRELYITIGLDPSVTPGDVTYSGDNLQATRIMYRVEWPDEKGHVSFDRMGRNCWADANVTYADLLNGIQREAEDYLPSSASAKSEETHNGYKIGDEVMWDRYGNGKWEKVKIEDFDADGSPIFEAVKGVMSEKGDWSRVKLANGIFGEAQRVARATQEKKKKATADNVATATGNKSKKSRKKDVTLKPEQPIGGLFADLNEEPQKQETDERKRNQPSQEVAGGELAHTVGTDATGTDGRVSSAGVEQTDKGRATHEAGAGVERGTDRPTHGTDENRGLQPVIGNRGRDESGTDSRGNGSAVERGRTAGAGSVSERGADRGTERLSEGESSAIIGRGSGIPAVKKLKKPEVKYTHNFRYDEENGNEADTYTPSQRLEANVKAIETLADVLFGDKPATDEQKAIMSRFRGWGQVDLGKYYDLEQITRNTFTDTPINRLAQVIKRLDPSGDKNLFGAIKRASLSSYYTPTPIARAMNTFLALAGYKGGSLLDPSMGNGMFEGTLPKSIQERTSITGVELDWLSGQLSRALYPDANVMISAFEKSGIAPGSFDVVTSNVPFGDIVVNDPTWKNDGTPLKRSAQNRIHNYYAVKMLEATRSGGLVAMMTTSAVMDTQSNQNIRAHIADQGEILGAIRLPDNTFQGTGVVTDIIFVRKWRDEQDREQTRADESYMDTERAFLSQHERTAPNKLDGTQQKVSFNGYYKLNPRNLIGEIQAGNQYGKKDAFGLTSKLTVDEIASEVEKAIKRIVGSRRGSLFNPSRTIRETQQAIRETYKGNGDWVSNGNLVVQGGKVGVLTAKSNEYGEVTRTFEGTLKYDRMLPRIEAMIELRTKMKTLIAFEIEGEKEHHIAAVRAELQKAYDNFVGKFGRLQDKDNSFILDDIDGYTLQALEVWKNGKFVGLSDIFTKSSIKPSINLEGKKTPQEAVALSLAEYGYLRPDYLAKALGEDWVEQCGDVVFLKPNSEDDYVTRDEYLSGDVVTKLADARAAAEKDKSFERNVKALEDVQPERIPFDDITIHLGARWIPEEVLNDFVNELLGIHAVYSNRGRKWDPELGRYVNEQKSGVRYIPETDSFEINIEKKELGGEASDWETPKKSAKEILQAALEDKTLVIIYKDKDGNTHVDDEQTELANQKIADLRERFETWLPSDPARVDLMEQLYNDRFNRTVIRHFDGSHLIVPGLMGKELRPHQKDAVWMLINNRGGIVDHIVGAGKTLVMQSAIMEMRRMGIAKKPMIVALKSTVAQIAREFKEAFPSARVLAPNDSDFKKENRKKFIANISLNDYDCVILSHEQYCMLPHTEEAERAVIDEQMWQLDNMIEYLYGTNDTSQMTKKQIKALEKRRENLKARLEKRLDRAVDREFCFENLGVDYLFVDESHQFKALPYVTSYQKVAGLGDPQGSNRAVALLTGIRHLQRMHQGDKGTVFLSGTTITNSLVETYNLLNYLRPRKLEELGMPTFDAWASTFAVHTSELEATITGGFALKDRFRQFDNVAELSQLYAEIADVRNDQNLKLPKPGIDAHTVIVPASDAMSEINSEIVNMIESKDGKYFGIYPKDPNRAPWGLHASTISAKAAVSPRLIFPDMNDDGGKVHAVCENVKKYYDEMAEQRGVQLIFCEIGVPGKGKEYDAYTDMVNRFVNDYGIPRSEIAYIQEAPTEEKRKDLFQRVRDGKVRILIGGTKNMGTGVNVQDRITDMHMLTVPWTPAALEQCIGRGGRQGNMVARDFMGNKVRVHYYATEGSLDLYKYQLLDAKGKMITQFKMGTVCGTRSFDEGSADEDGNMDPAEMVAILSGNPVIFEKAKQEKLVKKLRALRNGFERDYQRKKAKYEELKKRKENFERLIRLNGRDRADLERNGFKPDEKGIYPTTVTINDTGSYYGGGRTFDKPKEAGEYLLSALDKGKSVTLQGFGQHARVATVNEEKGNSLFSFRELQIGEGDERSIRYSVRLSDDATAAGTAYRNLLKRIIDVGEVYRRELESVNTQLSGMNIGDGVFPRQAEYDEATAKLKELTAEFNKLGKKSETTGDGNKYRDGAEMSDGERLRAIRVLEPIAVERNELSREELREVYNNLPSVEKDGREIEFYRSAFKKIYKDGGLFGQVVPVLDEVLEKSVLAYSEEDNLGGTTRPDGTIHKEHPNVDTFDNYVGKVSIDGKEYYVRTTVQTQAGQSGTHSVFVTEVSIYENTASSLSYPGTPRARVTDDGIVDAKLQHFFERASSEALELDKADRVRELSEKLNTPIRVVSDAEEIRNLPMLRQRRSKGWWSAKDDEVVIVLPNNVNVADVDNTFVHEVVGHKGLRALIGEERFDEFLGEIYDHASNPIRKVIDKITDKMVNEEADRLRVRKAQAHERAGEDVNANYYTDMAEARVEAEKKREEFRKEATEEYMSDLGGRIGSEGFEKMSRDELTLWGKIKAKVQAFLDKFLQGLKIAKSIRLNDKDLSYILYKSWKNLRKKGVFADAEDVVMRRRTGYDADEVTRFRDPGLGLEETITKMKAEAMQANAGNLQAKRDAMRAIGGNLNHLRQAMARQREYDITTVKSVADLARVLMDTNLLDDLSKYETKRILGAINNVVGKQDVSQYVQKVMDIMVDNQLRMGANTLGRLLSIRGSRVDARGIEVQGELDPDGQRIAQVVRKSTSLPKDDIDNRIAEAINRMSSTDQAIADEATIEYAGLQIARQYVEDITESKAEEKALRDSIREAKEAKDAGQMTEDAYRQYVESTEDAIHQNKIERAEAFHSLVEQIGGVLSESVERAKAWREAEKQRVEEIHHNANSDMEGRPTDEHHKDDRMQKLANNSFARFLLSPLATFDQMLRMFGKKNSRGEGYLWNRYMRDWVTATEKEYTGYRDALKVLDAKVSEIYGKDMTWGDLFNIDRKLPKASVRFFDGGEMKDHELTQGNLLYIYMADKMSDGRMKLRRMGITEEDIENIKNFLDPKFMQLADWMQEEFLVDKRNEYNEVHKRMFGASMAAIENYFPLKILANARLEDVDVADDTTDTALPATSTGSIIKRRRNNLALDVTGANAFSVILDHLQQMERWAAFAEFNRDLNTLLSYKRFRNQVMNMSSVYGAGKTLWNNFRNVCSMAAGAYRPPIAALDKSAVNIAKGVTAAKVSFRVFTALKQFLSMPAYVSDSNPLYLAANIANPIGAWRWSMENLPLFEKRWRSRMAGDPRLLKSEMDWKMWRSRVVELASRVGMAPNAFVDALTVAIGAHAMYQTKLAKYKRYGYDPDVAEARAKQDATILFNQTQQSSEGAFLSTMQVDRSWLSVLFTVFRNSSMSYTRQLYDSLRNIGRRLTPGYKALSEEFMAKQMRRDGIDPDKADRNAKQEYRRGIIRDLVRVGIFGYVLQLAWNMGAYLPYLIFGDDDDEKDKMWDDVFTHTMFGSIEGLTGGDVMSAIGNMWFGGDGYESSMEKDMPISSDFTKIGKELYKYYKSDGANGDLVMAMNDVINLLVQSAVGVNPQSLTDAVVAVMDVCGDDAQTSRECALLMARVLNCPQSQLDKIYFDELGSTGEEASQMTPYEIAERYARYKVRRGAPLTGWAYGNEQREKIMDKYRKKSNTLAKERLTRETDTQASPNMTQWLEEFEATKDRVSDIKKVKSRDEDHYYELLDELEATPEFSRYEIIRAYKHDVDELTKEWLNATTPAQRDSCVQAILTLKRDMVRELSDTQQ
jgi:N12 class adenine-specific DNA methylase|nr:MAG TPA: Type I restriction enzyme [Caudoviricetes sp.]